MIPHDDSICVLHSERINSVCTIPAWISEKDIGSPQDMTDLLTNVQSYNSPPPTRRT